MDIRSFHWNPSRIFVTLVDYYLKLIILLDWRYLIVASFRIANTQFVVCFIQIQNAIRTKFIIHSNSNRSGWFNKRHAIDKRNLEWLSIFQFYFEIFLTWMQAWNCKQVAIVCPMLQINHQQIDQFQINYQFQSQQHSWMTFYIRHLWIFTFYGNGFSIFSAVCSVLCVILTQFKYNTNTDMVEMSI